RIAVALIEELIGHEAHQLLPTLERRHVRERIELRLTLRGRIAGAVEDRFDFRRIRTVRLRQRKAGNRRGAIEVTSLRVQRDERQRATFRKLAKRRGLLGIIYAVHRKYPRSSAR